MLEERLVLLRRLVNQFLLYYPVSCIEAIITSANEPVKLFLTYNPFQIFRIQFVLVGLESVGFGETGYHYARLVGCWHQFVVQDVFVLVRPWQKLLLYLVLHPFLRPVHQIL